MAVSHAMDIFLGGEVHRMYFNHVRDCEEVIRAWKEDVGSSILEVSGWINVAGKTHTGLFLLREEIKAIQYWEVDP